MMPLLIRAGRRQRLCGNIIPGRMQQINLLISSKGAWRIVGVFSDKEKAIAECKADHYFVLEKSIDKTGETNGMEFPLSEKKE